LRRTFSGSAFAIATAVAVVGPARVPRVEPPAAAPATETNGPAPYRVIVDLGSEKHLSAVRARFRSTLSGVPIRYTWEIRACGANEFEPIAGASEDLPDEGARALPRRRTWFVDAKGCALRLTVLGTNAGVPAIESIEPVEGARDLLRSAIATDDADRATPTVTDGAYETGWTGTPGRGRWTLTLPLPHAERIDRVRLILGSAATSIARAGLGRNYAVARAPLRWSLLASEDGTTFTTVARSGAAQVRRPLVRLKGDRAVTALKLVLEGSTDDDGIASPAASPMVREISAYAAGDQRPVVSEPWVLSVNANPAASGHAGPGGELANDAYFAKFLQLRFANLSSAVARDDRYTRMLGSHGELLRVESSPSDGRGVESIEGDDPILDANWLSASWPPPIVVLSGSNDWDYARRTSTTASGRTRWNPLLSAREGGMGALATAVRDRAAPMIGICGGAQILALLEARQSGDGDEIDGVLRRNTGRPIRGFAPRSSLIRAWPGESGGGVPVSFDAHDPLFADIGARGRTTTHAFPQSHLDLIRPEAFADDAPLARFKILATSLFCSPVVLASLHSPNGKAHCARVTEAFRARDGAWPLIGVQFHPEQRDFAVAPGGDPPEAVADARLFLAAAYEEIVDAQLRNAAR
jgi:hypothetical protein